MIPAQAFEAGWMRRWPRSGAGALSMAPVRARKIAALGLAESRAGWSSGNNLKNGETQVNFLTESVYTPNIRVDGHKTVIEVWYSGSILALPKD